MTRRKDTEQDTEQDTEEQAISEAREVENEAPTSNDVGKQTLTKADLGYDVTKEGVPPDEVAMETAQHPDDPSAHEESEYNLGLKTKE